MLSSSQGEVSMGKEFSTIQGSNNTKPQRFDKVFKLQAVLLLKRYRN